MYLFGGIQLVDLPSSRLLGIVVDFSIFSKLKLPILFSHENLHRGFFPHLD